MTAIGNLSLFLVHFFTKDLLSRPLIGRYASRAYPSNLCFYIISGSCLVLSWITLIILQNLQICQKICCSCCQSDQVFQKTALDPNNPDELIYISKPVPQDIEMEVQANPSQGNLDPSILEDIRTLPKKLKNIASGSVLVSDEPKQSKLKSKLIQNVSWILKQYFIFFTECANIKSTESKDNSQEVENADTNWRKRYFVVQTIICVIKHFLINS